MNFLIQYVFASFIDLSVRGGYNWLKGKALREGFFDRSETTSPETVTVHETQSI